MCREATFTDNTGTTVDFVDIAGNTGSAEVKITWIDNAPLT
jgi:hypothetical protein